VDFRVILLDRADEFIHNLPSKLEAKTLRAVNLLIQFGHNLREPHSKTLKDAEGLKELRVQVGTNICRLFYFHYKDVTYIVTSGYVKKDQKTNQEEINRALRIKHDFFKEHSNENG
jgi:phage-related protein